MWCKNCAMGKDCIAYQEKHSLNDCALYLPMRFDGSVRLNDLNKKKEEKKDE